MAVFYKGHAFIAQLIFDDSVLICSLDGTTQQWVFPAEVSFI
jgi:hypothetical protein